MKSKKNTTTTMNNNFHRNSSVKWLKPWSVIVLAWLWPYSNGYSQELFLEGLISTPFKERDMTISKEENHLLFSIHSYNEDVRMIVEMRKENGSWSVPSVVSFSGSYKDIEPMFAPDNKRLFFASDRPMFEGDASNDYNIWVVERKANGWGIPSPLDSLINTEGDEFYPSVTKNGTIYFTATRKEGIGKEDIYYSKFESNAYSKPVCLDTAINSATYEFNSFIDPDEKFILFSSYQRADGLGGGDLYISYQKNGKWQPAKHLKEGVNSTNLDYCPFVSADGKTLYFTSNRKAKKSIKSVEDLRLELESPNNGFDNIYKIPFEGIFE